MSSNVGIWSPNELILPTVESDLDYKFFFVTESGSIDGLNIVFNSGDWLVYIKKDGVGNWYKTSGGVVSFNMSSSANAPDPGFYTRVRLDQNGNVIDAGYITKDDLPEHTHDIDTITGDWKTKIQKYVVDLFANKTNGTVNFKFDPDTETISADVNIDEDTIVRNEWGELEANVEGGSGSSSGGSASSFTGKIKIKQVEDLSDRLLAIDDAIKKNFIICRSNSGLKKQLDPDGGGTLLSVKFDGTSLVLNSDGELSVSPSVLLGGATDGSDTACGAHTHTVSQITDFDEKVLELINKNQTLDITQIPIDGQTIIINSDGHLACVAAGTKAHKHAMSDITDLKPEIADTWASDQQLQKNQDYTKGALNLTGQTIGYSVKVINEYLKDVDQRISDIESKIDVIEVPEPDGIEMAKFSVEYVGELEVTDKDTFKKVTAGESAKIVSDYFYPANEGTITVFIDGVNVFSLQMDKNTTLYSSPTFKMTGIRDSYYNIAMYRGKYNSMQIRYDAQNLDEGYHAIRFEHLVNGAIHKSVETYFQTYQETTPVIINSNLAMPANNTHISGIPCYNGDGKISFMPKVSGAYKEQFINDKIFEYSKDNGDTWETPEIVAIANGFIYYNQINLFVEKGNTGSYTVQERCYNVTGKEFNNSLTTPSLLWNVTDIEQYRVVHGRDFDGQEPESIGAQVLNEYDSTDEIPLYEMVIQNNVGSLNRTNYGKVDGPDYSERSTDKHGFVWCNFKFEAPFMNNLHVDLTRGDGTLFAKNKNGTLEGVKIYVSQSSGASSAIWVDGNSPYVGYGKADSINSKGLDLFKSDNKTRYITFGQRPNIDYGYLYVKVGTTSDVDLGALVSSIKESINEWS